MDLWDPGDFRIWRLEQVPILVCPPEIDIANSDAFAAALATAERAAATVVVDLTATTFCDGSGLRALVPAQQRAAGRGGQIRLVTRSALFGLLLGMTRLAAAFPRHPTVADAVQATLAGSRSSQPATPR